MDEDKADAAVEEIKPAEIAAGTATNDELTLDLPKFDGTGFYTVVASPTPLTVVK